MKCTQEMMLLMVMVLLLMVFGVTEIESSVDRCRATDHPTCAGYQNMKTFYCGHLWTKKYCKGMCGICNQQAKEDPCKPNPCKNNGRCAPISQTKFRCICGGSFTGRHCDQSWYYKWPHGNYAVLSRDKCPPGWFEFTHCMDTEDYDNRDDVTEFNLGLGNLCTESSVTFRYCFIGPKVPTRSGGFWVSRNTNSFAYVIKAPGSKCERFGKYGGEVFIDNENDYNNNRFGNDSLNGLRDPRFIPDGFNVKSRDTQLRFCKIGEALPMSSTNYIQVGEFNRQTFGFFVQPENSCPKLKTPYGTLSGEKQNIFMDDQDGENKSRVVSGQPPVALDSGDSRWAVCKYDPNKVEKR